MQLSIDQAAARIGKSTRQIRYLIQTEKLPAEKIAGRWMIDSANLELSEGQRKALSRKQRQLRNAVEKGLDLDGQAHEPRYSVRDMKLGFIMRKIHTRHKQNTQKNHQRSPSPFFLRGRLGGGPNNIPNNLQNPIKPNINILISKP